VERSDLTGAILDGRYQVLEPVSEGAMGVVYRAERVKLGRIVAIKVLHDVLPAEMSGRQRFEIEAKAMAKLEHPHCASVLDVGVHDDRPYVVMDFVSGENLKDLIANGPVPIPRAVEIARQVLSGLAHAHEHGIIHRDIKPANLVLSQKTGLGDHVKILDFGLARLHDTGQNLTTGMVVGTPAYMAPEQIRGLVLDHRVDLYACGVLLFELLTGHKPFHSENDDPIEVCKMHLSDPVPRLDAKLPGVDFGELQAVVGRALAKDRDDRYASAQEYAAALDAVAPRRSSVPVVPVTPPSPGGTIEITAADLVTAQDAWSPPSIEARSADIMAAIPVAPPHADTGDDPPAPAVSAPAVSAPAGSAPAGVPGPSPESPVVVESSPSMFLGIPVTPPASVAPRAASPGATHPPPEVARKPPEAARKPPEVARKPPAMRRRTLAIGSITLIAGTIAVAAVVLWGRPPASTVPADAGGAAVASGSVSPPDPGHEIVAQADGLLAQGDREAALDLLNRSRRQYPASAVLPFAAGRIYFAKFYWTEGLKSFREAIRIDPAYRNEPELIKTVLRGFIMTPSYSSDLASFLREDIGSAARPLLEETARDHPNPAIRSRAASALRRHR
jgi:serine/threonine-protein kinase